MKKLLVIILTLLMSLIGATTLMGCGETEQPDNRSGFEKIVDFIEETGTDNVIYLRRCTEAPPLWCRPAAEYRSYGACPR